MVSGWRLRVCRATGETPPRPELSRKPPFGFSLACSGIPVRSQRWFVYPAFARRAETQFSPLPGYAPHRVASTAASGTIAAAACQAPACQPKSMPYRSNPQTRVGLRHGDGRLRGDRHDSFRSAASCRVGRGDSAWKERLFFICCVPLAPNMKVLKGSLYGSPLLASKALGVRTFSNHAQDVEEVLYPAMAVFQHADRIVESAV